MASISKYPPISTWETLLQRPTQSVEAIEAIVDEVFLAVKQEGDAAITRYTKRFDKVELTASFVSQEEIEQASALVSNDLKESVKGIGLKTSCFFTFNATWII